MTALMMEPCVACHVPTLEPTQEEVDNFVWMEVTEDGDLVDPDPAPDDDDDDDDDDFNDDDTDVYEEDDSPEADDSPATTDEYEAFYTEIGGEG